MPPSDSLYEPRRRRTFALLELDPDLADGLTADRAAAANDALRAPLFLVRRGHWPAAQRLGAGTGSGCLGLLIVSGVAARELGLAHVVSSELMGPGDLIVPWARPAEPATSGGYVRWQVLAEMRVAVLDRGLAAALPAFPEINSALIARVAGQGERLAALKAIAQLTSVERRLLALFCHLAGRWGRVTGSGVTIPLTLSHRLLGELVGARRPTVTSAVAALARAGAVERRDDGTWVLHAPLPEADEVTHTPVEHRRRLLVDPLASLEGAGSPRFVRGGRLVKEKTEESHA